MLISGNREVSVQEGHRLFSKPQSTFLDFDSVGSRRTLGVLCLRKYSSDLLLASLTKYVICRDEKHLTEASHELDAPEAQDSQFESSCAIFHPFTR